MPNMRAQSPNSMPEDPAEIAALQQDLARMRLSYRVMQNDYRAYREQTKRNINKQTLLIEELAKERTELDTILGNMESAQNRGKDDQNAKKLKELSCSEKEYHRMINQEQGKIKKLDGDILAMERRIAEQRKKMGGIHNSTSIYIAKHKLTAVLENRLDKAVVHFNQQLAENSKLREDIDHYRRERSVFEGLYKRLAKQLEQTKTETAEVIRQSTQAFEQRDEAQSKNNALKERTEKDQLIHDMEMKELQRIITHDNKMKEFMQIKANDRADYKAEEAAKKKKYETNIDADQIFIQTYEEAFERIKKVTGLEEVTDIVENFVSNEDENFALFNYVNELNCEVDSLHDEVDSVKANIKEFNEQDDISSAQHSKLISEWDTKSQKASEMALKSETRLKEVNKTLDHLRHNIQKLFDVMGCDCSTIKAMLGGEAGISNKNVMVYLGEIEHKATDFLHVLHYLEEKKRELERGSHAKIVLPKPPQPPIMPALNIQPPAWDIAMESGSDDEGDLVPVTQAELRERISKDIERRVIGHTRPENTLKPEQKSIQGKKKKSAKNL